MKLLTTLAKLAIPVVASLAMTGCVLASQAKPRISSSISCESDFIAGDDGLDAGYRMKFSITNDGDQGEVQVIPRLSTSEGEWSRDQTLVLEKGETRQFSFFFQEPTINATNAQCRLTTLP